MEPLSELVYRAMCASDSRLSIKQKVISAGYACQVEVELDYQPPMRVAGRVLTPAHVGRRIERETACLAHKLCVLLDEHSYLMDRHQTDTNAACPTSRTRSQRIGEERKNR
jgi:hypothetical protein